MIGGIAIDVKTTYWNGQWLPFCSNSQIDHSTWFHFSGKNLPFYLKVEYLTSYCRFLFHDWLTCTSLLFCLHRLHVIEEKTTLYILLQTWMSVRYTQVFVVLVLVSILMVITLVYALKAISSCLIRTAWVSSQPILTCSYGIFYEYFYLQLQLLAICSAKLGFRFCNTSCSFSYDCLFL